MPTKKIAYKKYTNKKIINWLKIDGIFGVANSLIGMVSLPILINNLGQINYGRWLYVLSLIGYLGLITISINLTVVKKINDSLYDQDKLKIVSNNAFFAQLFISFLIIAISFICCFGLLILNQELILIVSFATLSLSVSISASNSSFIGILSGLGYGKICAIIGGGGIIVQNIAIILTSFFSQNLIVLSTVQLLTSFTITLIFAFTAYKLIGWKIQIKYFSKYQIKDFFSNGKHLQIIHISEIMSTNFPATFIHNTFGPSYVTIYATLTKFPIVLGNSLIMKVVGVYYPYLQNIWSRGLYKIFWRFFFRAQYLSITYGMGVFIFFSFAYENVFEIFRIEIQNIPIFAGVLIGVLALRESVMRSIGIFIVCSGNYKYARNLALIDTSLTIISPILLFKWIGIYSVFSGPILSFIINYYLINKLQQKLWPSYIVLNKVLLLILFIIIYLFVVFLAKYFISNSYILLASIFISGLLIEFYRYRLNGFGQIKA